MIKMDSINIWKIEDITKDKKDINIINVDYNKTNIKDFKNLISDIKLFNGINLDTISFYSFGGQSQIKEINVFKKRYRIYKSTLIIIIKYNYFNLRLN